MGLAGFAGAFGATASEASSGATPIDAGADLRQAIAQHRSRASDETCNGGGANDDDDESSPRTRSSATKAGGDRSRSLAPKLGATSTALAAFIPPQFVRPPENGANIKPSEYLRRISATSAPVGAGVGQSAPTELENEAKSEQTQASDASSDTTTSTSPTSYVFKQQQQQQQQQHKQQQSASGATNRFRHMAALRNPLLAGELHRSQSTSALNRLRSDADADCQSDADDSNSMGDSKDSDSVVSGSTSSSASGPSARRRATDDHDHDHDHDEAAQVSARADDCSILPSMRDFRAELGSRHSSDKSSSVSESCGGSGGGRGGSNLMNALRNFDRSKHLKSVSKAHSVVGNGAIGRNGTSGSVSKLDLMLDATKRDLIAELKETKNLDGIKRMKESYRFKGDQLSPLLASKLPEFKPEDYLDKVTQNEPSAPLWRRQMLAKKAAERARKEHEERVRLEIEEKRHNQVPAWKRQMLAKKTAERRRRSSEMDQSTKQLDRSCTGKSASDESAAGLNEIRCFGNDSSSSSSDGVPVWRRHLGRVARSHMTASTDNVNIISNLK